MSQRPRLLAACLIAVATSATACSLEVTYSGSHYACSDGECPSGYGCVEGFCQLIERSLDAAAGDDATDVPDASTIDGALEPPPDAAPPPPPDAAPPPPDAAPPLPDAGIPCSGSSTVRDPTSGHCYIRVSTSRSWLSAQSNCLALGAHLAIITSAAENLVVKSLDDGTIAESWIGASDSSAEGDWRWLDGTDFPPSPAPNASSFQNWNQGEPNNFNNEDCALIELSGTGEWDDRNCGATLSSICERQ